MFTDLMYLWNVFTLSLGFQKVWFLQNQIFDKLPGQNQIQSLKGEFCNHIVIALFKQTNRWLKHESKRIKHSAECDILGRWNEIKIKTWSFLFNLNVSHLKRTHLGLPNYFRVDSKSFCHHFFLFLKTV